MPVAVAPDPFVAALDQNFVVKWLSSLFNYFNGSINQAG